MVAGASGHRIDKTAGEMRNAPRGEATVSKSKPVVHIQYHKDCSVWARGQVINGVPIGYLEWFRKDGVRMRSGHFDKGEQVGGWISYDKAGAFYKVATVKPKKRKDTR